MIEEFQPIYQPRIWGGRKLETMLHREIPAKESIGESWELVDRPETQSVRKSDGKTLHDLWNSSDRATIFGTDAPNVERFPILIKILDATDKLSVQVHPPAAQAAKLGGEPKTEMWYFLHTDANALIYVGLKKGVTQARFEQALTNGSAAECLHTLHTAPREVMYLPSGRLHTIGAGNLILEIQQNSDTTYRVYDWDRVDAMGRKRDLHIEKSLACIRFDDYEPTFTQPHGERILNTPFFDVSRINLYEREEREIVVDTRSFQYLFIAAGTVKIGGKEYHTGHSLFLSAGTGFLEVEGTSETNDIVIVSFPKSR